MDTNRTLLDKIDRLNAIGVALSEGEDELVLLERILLGAKELTGSDGGTLYLLNEQHQLEFRLLFTDSLGLAMGGRNRAAVTLAPLDLYSSAGEARNHLIAVRAALSGEVIRVDDAYASSDFDFSGARQFDQRLGYHTQAVLAVPMRNHEKEVIGVIQLINPLIEKTAVVRAFTHEDLHFCRSLASQAAVALTQNRLIAGLEELFDALIRMIATTIDEKSKFTGSHCRQVPQITLLIADALENCTQGSYADWQMKNAERRELELAAWLHDCGKLSTPVHLIDKQTKLEGIRDNIELVATRMAVLRAEGQAAANLQPLPDLQADFDFLHQCNSGGEFLQPAEQQRIAQLAKTYYWPDLSGRRQPLLTAAEIADLQISRGTLNDQERAQINSHVVMTRKILTTLPFPKHLRNVPEIAARHHEKLNGKGYPHGLSAAELGVPERILAIADIFESLVACDRPYRPAKKLSEVLQIMAKMVEFNDIDGEIYACFITSGAMEAYVRENLSAAQLDVDFPQLVAAQQA